MKINNKNKKVVEFLNHFSLIERRNRDGNIKEKKFFVRGKFYDQRIYSYHIFVFSGNNFINLTP